MTNPNNPKKPPTPNRYGIIVEEHGPHGKRCGWVTNRSGYPQWYSTKRGAERAASRMQSAYHRYTVAEKSE
jgi:hypothetical protein